MRKRLSPIITILITFITVFSCSIQSVTNTDDKKEDTSEGAGKYDLLTKDGLINAAEDIDFVNNQKLLYSQTDKNRSANNNLLGDTNNDGIINIVDALITAQFYVGITAAEFNENAADVSGDGLIDIVDALLIAQYYVGIINVFPADQTLKELTYLTSFERFNGIWVNQVFVDKSGIYTATNNGLYISNDNGATWTNYGISKIGGNNVKDVFVYNDTIFTGSINTTGNGSGGLAVSNNQGNNWTIYTSEDGLISTSIYKIYADNTKVIIGSSTGISISKDNCLSWTNHQFGSWVHDIFINNNIIYIATEKGIYISNDEGLSWDNFNNNNGIANDWINGVYAASGKIYAATYNNMYLGGGLSVSDNNGASWTTYTSYNNGLASDYTNSVNISNGIIYVSTESGLSISKDNCTTWQNYKLKDYGLLSNNVYNCDFNGDLVYVAAYGSLSVFEWQ